MLLEALGWRFLFKILRFPLRFDAFGGFWVLRFDAFGGFWMEISITIWRFPLRFDGFGGFWMETSILFLQGFPLLSKEVLL